MGEPKACAVNNTDLNTRTGWYGATDDFLALLKDQVSKTDQGAAWGSEEDLQFPRIQGADIAGTVMKVGSEVHAGLLNKKVLVDLWVRGSEKSNEDSFKCIGSELNGGFAEYVVVPVENAHPAKTGLSDEELACIPCAYSTAENMLTKASVGESDTVLIVGASGGVGSAAIQLTKIRNPKAIIALASPAKFQQVKEAGADICLASQDPSLAENLATHKITVALDMVGGASFDAIMKRDFP